MLDYFYIGANTQDENGGILIYDRKGKDGKYCKAGFLPLAGVSYFILSPDEKFLYTVRNVDGNGFLDTFLVEDGGKTLLPAGNSISSRGCSCCHLTLSPDGRYIYLANYRTGSFAQMALKNGLPDESTFLLIEHKGECGPNKERQESPHCHFTGFTPDGKYLCIVDLGMDSVFLYAYTPFKGIEKVPSIVHKEAPGEGPRHLVFSPCGLYCYIVNELGNTVSFLAYHPLSGSLKRLANYSTIPADFRDFTKASAIRISPDGKYLFATNRGHESCACFRIKGDHSLELYDITPIVGKSPRDMNFLEAGNVVGFCNEFTSDMTLFQLDEEGKLSFTGEKIPAPGALCLL